MEPTLPTTSLSRADLSASAIHASARLPALLERLNQIILGKADAVRDAVTCLLANGHLLIEDMPGVGKTTLFNILLGFYRPTAGRITIDGVPYELHEGESIVMPARHPHAVYGQEQFKMLLVVVF